MVRRAKKNRPKQKQTHTHRHTHTHTHTLNTPDARRPERKTVPQEKTRRKQKQEQTPRSNNTPEAKTNTPEAITETQPWNTNTREAKHIQPPQAKLASEAEPRRKKLIQSLLVLLHLEMGRGGVEKEQI